MRFKDFIQNEDFGILGMKPRSQTLGAQIGAEVKHARMPKRMSMMPAHKAALKPARPTGIINKPSMTISSVL